MDTKTQLGFNGSATPAQLAAERADLLRYLNLKLAAKGLPCAASDETADLIHLASGLLANHREKTRLLAKTHSCPIDRRIETFLNRHFDDVRGDIELRTPRPTLILDRHGIARELSVPADRDEFESPYLKSYRVRNGVLHNPRADRRTTAGTFHVAEGGLPIPGDKRAVPRETFVKLWQIAVAPPSDQLVLPFTAYQEDTARSWVSLMLRPLVCPEVPGVGERKTMEVRFFAPGLFVSNLDFVESIFGNAGDPFIPENDAALDVEHWSGHTGCVVLAPHLTQATKKQVGLRKS